MDKVRMTDYGIVYDIEQTPFVRYRNGLNFHFSSRRHLEKFTQKMVAHEQWLNDSMSRRFHVEVDMRVLADIQLYMRIETGAFYVKNLIEGKVYRCPEDVKLDGLHVRSRNSQTPFGATTEQSIG